MRHQLDHFQIGTNAADYQPPDTANGYGDDKIPDGTSMRDLQLIVSGTAVQKNATAAHFTGAHLKAALAIVFGAFTSWFGKKPMQLVDESLSLDELRILIQTMTGRDVLVNTSSGLIELNALADATNLTSGTVAQDATHDWSVVIHRPYAIQRLAVEDRERHCPGATQARQLRFKIRRASGFTTSSLIDTKWAQSGNIDVKFGIVPGVSRADKWVEPVILSRINVDGSTHRHPGGRLIYFAERSQPESSTNLDLITLRAGSEIVVNQGDAAQIKAELAYTKPEGYESRSTVETPLFLPVDGATYESLPVGDPIVFDQIGNAEENPADTVAVVAPAPRANFGQIVADNIRDPKIPASEADKLSPILTNAAAYESGGSVAQSVAAMAGIAIVRPEHRDYALTAGEKVMPKGGTVRVVPAVVLAQAKGAQASAVTEDEKDAAAQSISERLAKAMPAAGIAKRSGSLKPVASELARNVLGLGSRVK